MQLGLVYSREQDCEHEEVVFRITPIKHKAISQMPTRIYL